MSTASTPVRMGKAGLTGWRTRVADAVAGPAARRTPFDEEQVRAVVGAAFLTLSAIYLWKVSSELVAIVRR